MGDEPKQIDPRSFSREKNFIRRNILVAKKPIESCMMKPKSTSKSKEVPTYLWHRCAITKMACSGSKTTILFQKLDKLSFTSTIAHIQIKIKRRPELYISTLCIYHIVQTEL